MKYTIVTVTLNPAMDKTVKVKRFTEGSLNRVLESRSDPGGKGINVARVLSTIPSVRTIASGFIGGETGQSVLRQLQQLRIEPSFCFLDQETRTNMKVVDQEKRRTTEINEQGFRVTREDLERFETLFSKLMNEADAVVLSGSMPTHTPNDYYAKLIRLAKSKSVLTVLDAASESLACGIEAAPHLIKPNQKELEVYGKQRLTSVDQVVDTATRILEKNVKNVVVSLGGDGCIAVHRGRVIRAVPPKIEAQSTVGAGDSMVAVLAYALLEDIPFDRCIRLAVAAGTVTAGKEGTQVCTWKEIQNLSNKVKVKNLNAKGRRCL